MEFPKCPCNADSSFYCHTENSYLCAQHYKSHEASHNCYYYTGLLNPALCNQLIASFQNLKIKVEASVEQLNSQAQKLYDELNSQFQVAYKLIQFDIERIDVILENLQKQNEYIPAIPLFFQVLENESRVISSISQAFSLHIADQTITQELKKFISIYSGLDEFYTKEREQVQIDPREIEAIVQKYEIMKKAATLHPPSQYSDDLSNWIESMNCKRDCEKHKLLWLNGDKLTDHLIEGFSMVPNIFFIKELVLESFSSEGFDQTTDSIVSKCAYVENLQIISCEIDENAATKLSSVLQNNKNLHEIIVDDCQTGDFICVLLQKADLSLLETLVLSQTLIGDSGVSALCKLFPLLHHLKHLDLSKNYFGSQGGIELAIYLKYLTRLYEIKLSSNKIGEVAGEIFMSLSFLPRISSIDISSIDLRQEQHEFIINSIPRMGYLEILVLDFTTPESFMDVVKQIAQKFTHIYTDNPDEKIRIEFK